MYEDTDVIVSWNFSAVGLNDLWLPFTFASRTEYASFAQNEIAQEQLTNSRLLAFIPTDVKVMVAQRAIDSSKDIMNANLVDSGGLGEATIRALDRNGVTVRRRAASDIFQAAIQDDTIYSVPFSSLQQILPNSQNVVVSQTNHQFWGVWVSMKNSTFDELTPDQAAAVSSASEMAVKTATDEANLRTHELIDLLKSTGVTVHTPTMLNDLFAVFSPDESNSNGCTSKEYKKKIKGSCKCVVGNKSDEC